MSRRPSRVFGTATVSSTNNVTSTSYGVTATTGTPLVTAGSSPLKPSPLSSLVSTVSSSSASSGDISESSISPTIRHHIISPGRIDSPPSSEISINESISSSTSDETAAISAVTITKTNTASSTTLTVLSPTQNGDSELNESNIIIPSTEATNGEVSTATISSSPLLNCPICNESMVSLLQLNRHLDDVHSEVEQADNEQLKSWFRKKVEQAKQLQTVTSVLNSTLVNATLKFTDETGSDRSGSQTPGTVSPRIKPESSSAVNVEVIVPRDHWKNHGTGPGGRDKCSHINCDKLLNSRNGNVHCRQCGQLFCREHSLYQMKLSRYTAKHDPDEVGGGIWCRVCENCYKSRDGYNDNSGMMRDVTNQLAIFRQKRIDERELEVNKLEKRLVRLIRALTELDDEFYYQGLFNYAATNRRKSIEHQITSWQNDKDVHNCPICNQKFGYSLRKHHCRVCGKVVCADLGTDCSRDVPLAVLSNKLEEGGGAAGTELLQARRGSIGSISGSNHAASRDIGIRICRDCKNTIFARRNFEAELKGIETKSQMLKLYDSMARIRHSIDIILPRFQEMLTILNDPEHPPSHDILSEAGLIRKKLLNSFSQYDSMARKVLTCEVNNETEKRLQKQIYQVAAQFLQENMLPLRALPKILKHSKTVAGDGSIASSISDDISRSPSPAPAPPPPPPPLSEEEVQTYREQLIVMEEQKFMVESMIAESKKSRKFDELIPLEQNLTDLNSELDRIRDTLGSYSIS